MLARHTCGVCAPPVTGSTKTLSHWLGAHAYISTWNSESIVGFDLRVTNADSGNDPTTSIDDPLDKVYFKSFEVAVPNGLESAPSSVSTSAERVCSALRNRRSKKCL